MINTKNLYSDRYFKIKKSSDGFVFKVYPKNSKTQELGTSKPYSSKDDCRIGILTFVNFILDNKIESANSEHIRIKELEHTKEQRKHYYECFDKDEEMLFKSLLLENSSSIKKGVISLYKLIKNITQTKENI